MVEHYLFKMFHSYLLVGNFVICFWINLVFEIAFDKCSVFGLICLFGVILFICYVVSAGSSSQLVLILSLIFGWILSIQDVSLILFGRKFCNLILDQFGFEDIHVLFLTWSACFGSIVFICYVVSEGSSSQLVLILTLIFGWILSVQDVSLISFGRKFCNLFLD